MEREGAKIMLKWDTGREVQIGKVDAVSEESGQNPTTLKVNVQVSRKRMGWEIVKLGLRVIFTAEERGN